MPEQTACSDAERVETFRHFDNLQKFVYQQSYAIEEQLQQRPFPFGRTLLALSSLSFLSEHLDYSLKDSSPTLLLEHSSPEHLAESVSAAIALANDSQPLNADDFLTPLSGVDESEALVSTLRFAQALTRLRELGKTLAVFGYRLEPIGTGSSHRYLVGPPDHELEYALRLGYVRSESGLGASRLSLARRNAIPKISLVAAAEDLLREFPDLVQLVEPNTPLARLRFVIPLVAPLLKTIGETEFAEDAMWEEHLAQELDLPIPTELKRDFELLPGLGLNLFLRTWKVLRFLAVTELVALKCHLETPLVVHNSLVRIVSVDDLGKLLEAIGLSAVQVGQFLSLTGADVESLGFFDLQYRPFLLARPPATPEGSNPSRKVVYCSALVATSNIAVNVQRSHSIRFARNADAIVEIAAKRLRTIFSHVRTNVPLRRGSDETDVDVLAMSDDTLYLIECKHSVTPTGPHETRDLWNDVHRGAEQALLAKSILAERGSAYLAGLFPGTKKSKAEGLRIRTCVLCSHRVLSGLSIHGVPIRDLASFLVMTGDATVGMGAQDGSGTVTMQRYRLRPGINTSSQDVDDYLDNNNLYFRMFQPFMRPYTSLERLLGGAVLLAHSSFVFAGSFESWSSNLIQLGAVSVDNEVFEARALGVDHKPG